MARFLTFAGWPAFCGALIAVIVLQQRGAIPAAPGEPAPDLRSSYRAAVQSATPAVVNIYTAKLVNQRPWLLSDPLTQRMVPRSAPRQRVERSLGSGVIVSPEGHILTNNHVIDGADAIQVLLADGRTANAEVIGTDPLSDLALLQVELPDLHPIALADAKSVAVGDIVLAIGNPLGFGHSVTQGIVSALGRYGLNTGTYEGFIQTDATVHPGSSGGALVDLDGNLVGINTLIYTAPQQGQGSSLGSGISLAIPVNLATFVLNDLVRYGHVIRGWVGIEVEQVAARQTDGNLRQLLVVTGLAEGGPAQRGGLVRGDVITRVNGDPIEDVRLTMQDVALLRPGERLDVTVLRQETPVELQIVVGAQPGSGVGAA